MDAELRREAARLRRLTSTEAADIIIASYPRRDWPGVILVQHVTWKPADQMRLARHFLAGQPHASSRVLEAFAKFMSLQNFALVLEEVWPTIAEDARLFRYNLGWAMRQYAGSDQAMQVFKDLFEKHP